jgi:hypothetical protein
MKTSKFLACAILALSMATSCTKDDMPDMTNHDHRWEKVEPIQLPQELAERLNNAFSSNNGLRGDTMLIINSLEAMMQLQGSDAHSDVWKDFDWERRCIIGGMIITPSGSDKILSHGLLACIDKVSYRYEVEYKKCIACYGVIGVHYFWAAYPKKPNRKNTSFTISSGTEVDTVVIGKGSLHGAGLESVPKQNTVIKTKAEWDRLMAAMDAGNKVSDTFSETEIDFTKYQVIALFEEVKGNGGWSIDMARIVEYSEQIIVGVYNFWSGDATRVMTQPYHIVRVPASSKEVHFEFY